MVKYQYSCVNIESKLESTFHCPPNVLKRADLYEINRIFHLILTIVWDVLNVFPIQMVKLLTFERSVRE